VSSSSWWSVTTINTTPDDYVITLIRIALNEKWWKTKIFKSFGARKPKHEVWQLNLS